MYHLLLQNHYYCPDKIGVCTRVRYRLVYKLQGVWLPLGIIFLSFTGELTRVHLMVASRPSKPPWVAYLQYSVFIVAGLQNFLAQGIENRSRLEKREDRSAKLNPFYELNTEIFSNLFRRVTYFKIGKNGKFKREQKRQRCVLPLQNAQTHCEGGG